jgi:hypothetical protein
LLALAECHRHNVQAAGMPPCSNLTCCLLTPSPMPNENVATPQETVLYHFLTMCQRFS